MLAKKVMSLKDTVTSSNVLRKAFRWKLRQFKPKVPLYIESNRFLIKTVENSFELEKALNSEVRGFLQGNSE